MVCWIRIWIGFYLSCCMYGVAALKVEPCRGGWLDVQDNSPLTLSCSPLSPTARQFTLALKNTSTPALPSLALCDVADCVTSSGLDVTANKTSLRLEVRVVVTEGYSAAQLINASAVCSQVERSLAVTQATCRLNVINPATLSRCDVTLDTASGRVEGGCDFSNAFSAHRGLACSWRQASGTQSTDMQGNLTLEKGTNTDGERLFKRGRCHLSAPAPLEDGEYSYTVRFYPGSGPLYVGTVSVEHASVLPWPIIAAGVAGVVVVMAIVVVVVVVVRRRRMQRKRGDAGRHTETVPLQYAQNNGKPSETVNAISESGRKGERENGETPAKLTFTIHAQENRDTVLKRQNMGCAACNININPVSETGQRPRYCKYSGQYYCPSCHAGESETIPAYVIKQWDFTKFFVCNFARDLLRGMHTTPLFNVDDVNPNLYDKVAELRRSRDLRRQLSGLKSVLKACPQSKGIQEDMNKLESHWGEQDNLYSMADFIEVQKGTMESKLAPVVAKANAHVRSCDACRGSGFQCGVCDFHDVVGDLVKVCKDCGTHYHKECYPSASACPKCGTRHLGDGSLGQHEK